MAIRLDELQDSKNSLPEEIVCYAEGLVRTSKTEFAPCQAYLGEKHFALYREDAKARIERVVFRDREDFFIVAHKCAMSGTLLVMGYPGGKACLFFEGADSGRADLLAEAIGRGSTVDRFELSQEFAGLLDLSATDHLF